MTNYTKTTDFAAKDALPSGNSAKIVKGSEIDTEFNNIATASATKANKNNAALTGTTTFETISDGTIAITGFVDEDNMVSDSAALLPTQQSVKAYVDSQVTAQDLDFQADTGGALSIDLDSESLTFTGGTGIDTSGLGNAVTFAIDSTVATLTGTQTLSNKTLSAPAVSGNLTTDGLIDGRDVATDGTKLDGIESGATADQTAAEIKTAYESNANTNAFTDADESKLDGIEALADVTDTANVTAAGALMDSELTSEASVKALNQGVATTDSPTFAGLTTTADVSFGDNDKAIFGAGSDLQIYHDASHSFIKDAGTGHLKIQATNLKLQDVDGNNYIDCIDGSYVRLMHNTATKLETTATGIDVTGTVTADGLTVDGTTSFMSKVVFDNNDELRWKDSGGTERTALVLDGSNDLNLGTSAGGNLKFYNGSSYTERMRIDSSGNLLVGKTSTGIATVGTQIESAGGVHSTAASERAFIGNRTTTDGSIIELRKDNATVGSIGTYAGDLTIGDDDIGIRFDTGTGLVPWDLGANSTGGAARDAAIDIGASSARFKDLYLSGVAKVGSSTIYVHSDGPNAKVTFKNTTNTSGFDIGLLGGNTDDDAFIYNRNAGGNLIFGTENAEQARLDASGNLLVGRTSTSYSGVDLHVGNTSDSQNGLQIQTSTTGYGYVLFGDGTGADAYRGQITYKQGDDYMGFHTAGSERMRIDASGNLLVGKTVVGAPTAGAVFVPNNYLSVTNTQTGSTARLLLLNRQSGTGTAVEFRQANAGVGSISVTSSATAYNTSSDQRLKDNIVNAPSASDDIDAIQVRSFDWKADGSHQKYGMVAQELQSVAPEAVSGDADSDDMMGVDYSKLVPMMLKEIQSLRARVAQLEGE